MAILLSAVAVASFAATPTTASAGAPMAPSTSMSVPEPASRRPDAHWGAIAARLDGYGYAFNQPSRAAAEQVARAQCERPGGPPATPGTVRAPGSSSPAVGKPAGAGAGAGAGGACEVRVWFERSCGALATGNFGEWGAAVGADRTAATKAAVAQCDAHLPTEPCRAVVSACSLP